MVILWYDNVIASSRASPYWCIAGSFVSLSSEVAKIYLFLNATNIQIHNMSPHLNRAKMELKQLPSGPFWSEARVSQDSPTIVKPRCQKQRWKRTRNHKSRPEECLAATQSLHLSREGAQMLSSGFLSNGKLPHSTRRTGREVSFRHPRILELRVRQLGQEFWEVIKGRTQKDQSWFKLTQGVGKPNNINWGK